MAKKNIDAAGSASASIAQTQVQAAVGESSANTTATFSATPNSSYEFVGWGTSADAISYESTSNLYSTTITNSTPGSTANKTLYAIFKPVFNFKATAEKINGNYGQVTSSVTQKILGEPSENSKTTQATFTATPNENCTFHGWYYDAAHTQIASDEATYTPDITNNKIGSTENLTLYAWFKTNQTLTFNTATYEKNIVKGATLAGAVAATASSGLSVSYTSSNSNVVSVNDAGDVTGVSLSNDDVTITALQLGNDEYNPASITRYFTVISKINATVRTSLQTEGTNTLTVGEDPATIGCIAPITAANFTIAGNENDIITTSFANNTLTITPLKAGTVTITFSRAEDNGYNAISQSYTIEVVNAVLTLNPATAPEINFTEYSQITLQRTLKVGHSTLTLPFDTNISDLADDDSAYVAQLALATYNHADGYTLYFNKVEDGTILANQPYLIYLSQSVASPIVFENVTAVQPQAADVTKNGWTMHGNYTPGTSMNGRYGIAGGRLCLGSSNAKINAYTAYFEAPTTQNVKVRVAVEDGGGNTTWLGEAIEDEEAVEAIYGLDGMKLGTMKKGVNIVRQKDGTVKKVWKK